MIGAIRSVGLGGSGRWGVADMLGGRRSGVDPGFELADGPEEILAKEDAAVDALPGRGQRIFGARADGRHEGAQFARVGRKRDRGARLDGSALAEALSLAGAAHAATPMTAGATASLPVSSISTGTFATAARRIARAAEGRPFFGFALW
jgi:hypothetical protein